MSGLEIVEAVETSPSTGDGEKNPKIMDVPTHAIKDLNLRIKADAMNATGMGTDARISGHQSS